MLLARRYAYYARWFAVCRREDEANECRDKVEAIYNRLERMYEWWQTAVARDAASIERVGRSTAGRGAICAE